MTVPGRLRSLLRPDVVLCLPPLAAILVVGAYLAIESVRPGSLTAPRPETIPEAIVLGNGPRALEMMAEGLDVNRRASVRASVLNLVDSGLEAGAGYEMTPLEAALLAQRIEVVGLLLRTGADVTRSQRAPCLARVRLPEALSVLGLAEAEPEAVSVRACFAQEVSRGGRRGWGAPLLELRHRIDG